MHGVVHPFIRTFVLIVFVSIIPHLVFAAGENCDPWTAKAVSVQGTVESRSPRGGQWQQVTLDDTFCPGDEIRVLDNSRASLALANESVLRLNANSALVVQEFKEKTSFVDMFKGAAHFFARKPNKLEVNTPYVVAGVRGTEFFIRVEEDQTFLSIFEGGVLASNDTGEVTLASGQSAVAQKGRAPVLTTVVRPRDAVQWALYYPPVVYVPPGQPEMREDLNDPVFLANLASQSLAVGKIDAAEADLQKALAIDPGFAEALALQSIVALIRNDKENAYALAQQAVDNDPQSSSALVAKSYAQQAQFDLEGARQSLMDAVAADPGDALAYARLAEIQLSFGELSKAETTAKKATTLAPELSRTQTVLGFAYLTQVKIDDAMAAFDKAIQSDQTDPLPRLGMGLVRIRKGNLAEGRAEIEVAASLDPNNSLIRSYLGKAFFEEKRTGLDEREYQIAKELDPNDPTPHFYSAIAKQTTNRPVEALQDFETAKQLNDNRAVYRSRLLLDSDLAARSAATARIYSDLGFQQRALVEGYNAVNTDPTNFSAHRFLADSYAVLPRHEIARVSELLQSQLLQPSNMTPIQPSLAESNLFLISAGGAANTSFNEFNPLFNRNGAAVQLSGLVGENSTYGGEGVVSGIYNKLSMSAGYAGFNTDGYRENNDQEDDIVNVFAQYEFNYKTSLQAEYRYRDNERGDIQLNFEKDDILPTVRQTDETNLFRIGGRHSFAPGSDLIGNFSYQRADARYTETPDDFFTLFDIEIDGQESLGGELQYLHRWKYANFVFGGGYFDVDRDDKIAFEFDFPPVVRDEFTVDSGVDHANAYLYSYVKPLEDMTITLGASYDDFNANDEEGTKDADQFNPKIGLTWNLKTGTTLRGAAFRVLKRTLITDQTLEPTQVAGFNQFFDELNATDYWVYGGAIDQKFTRNIYGGLSYTYRDLDVPFTDLAGAVPEVKTADWEEQMLRAYLFWTPHKWFSLTAEYWWEDLDRENNADQSAPGASNAKTQYFPLGIRFFHPSGLGAMLRGTFVDQEGEFERKDFPGSFTEGSDDFFLVDAAISYRLPKRYGFLTLGVKNLFDEEFQYFDTDPKNANIQPARYVFAKVTLAFP